MKITAKILAVVGFALIAAAAFLCIALLSVFLGAEKNVPAFVSVCALILSGAYGFSSWLIPVFLLVAGIVALLPDWKERRAVYLGASVLPFFTIVITEKIGAYMMSGGAVPYLALKLCGVFAAAGLVIAIEYLFAGFVFDLLTIQDDEKDSIPAEEKPIFTEASEPHIFSDESDSDAITLREENNSLESMELSEIINPFTKIEAVPTILRQSDAEQPDFSNSVDISEEENTPIEQHIPEILANEQEFTPETAKITQNECIFDEKDTKITPVEANCAESDREIMPLESVQIEDEPIVFIDLNWKENNSVPVRLCTQEESGDDSDLYEENDENDEKNEEFDEIIEPFEEIIEETEEFDDENHVNDEFYESEKIIPPVLKRGLYRVPADGLLNTYPDGEYWIIDSETQRAASILKETLSEFKISAEVTGIRKGPVITMFEILPAPGVKLTRIVALQDNIALRLAASSVRIVAPIPGKHAVGIEVPNKARFIVSFRELIDNDAPGFKKMEIPMVLGKDITGEAQMLDLAATPHLLIAGSTGSGKSVCVNSLILSILYKRSPQDVKMILIDPKIVELKLYNDIPHLLTPVITEPKKAFQALQYCLCEMERRYSLLDKMGVRDIKSFNRRIIERNLANEKLAYIVVIIDEFADLMATTGKELESTVARLAAMSRAVGVHLVLATQRPSIDVITGLIKANIPTRIAFMVASKMDSRIIIDQTGAEKLLGRGDMLYSSAVDPFPVRIQGTYVSEEEVEHVVEYVKQFGEPEYIDEEIFFDDEEESVEPSLFGGEDDPLYNQALEIVLQAGKASASYIQRRLKIGYNRAARLVENMEQRGIVGPANGSKPREIVHVPR